MSLTDDNIHQIEDKWEKKGLLIRIHVLPREIIVDLRGSWSSVELRELAEDMDGLENDR